MNDWIRPGAPATGGGALAQTSEEGLAEASWELTDLAREQFQLPVHKRLLSGGLRTPFTLLGQLVLHEEAQTAIQMALAQVRNHRLLFDGWGLSRVISYGRGTTVLFSGPSGVGKTAAAEAMATELGRPMLEADISRLLSCWVGETEKNLTRLFYEARQTNAVLFFDEADALFFDRSMAGKSWEVSQVNVLLRQLECFEGLCILATNRSDCLDPAFVRRLSLRVDFQPPTPEMAERIWRLLLPTKLPLADDVDLVALGRLGLTGGQIKNAVVNAARRTAADGARRVTMAALLQSALAERGMGLGRIGFREEKGHGEPPLRPAA